MNKGVSILVSSLVLVSLSQEISATGDGNVNYSQYSCHQLYLLASQLEPQSQRMRSTIFNDKTDLIATAIGTVTSVGYYYFGFSTIREYLEDYRVDQHRQDLDKVRFYMAQQYCFQKF